MANTFAKLKNDEWGVRITGKDMNNVRPGKIIQVETKEASKSEQTVKAILHTYDDAIICSIFQSNESMARYAAQDGYLAEVRRQKKNAIND